MLCSCSYVLLSLKGVGVPLGKVCIIGGIHGLATAEAAINAGFCAVQLGRVLLADPDWCIKMGIATQQCGTGRGTGTGTDVSKVPVRQCDKSNDCIVGATMALEPLRCTKHKSLDW